MTFGKSTPSGTTKQKPQSLKVQDDSDPHTGLLLSAKFGTGFLRSPRSPDRAHEAPVRTFSFLHLTSLHPLILGLGPSLSLIPGHRLSLIVGRRLSVVLQLSRRCRAAPSSVCCFSANVTLSAQIFPVI